jgi:hypothetical protein
MSALRRVVVVFADVDVVCDGIQAQNLCCHHFHSPVMDNILSGIGFLRLRIVSFPLLYQFPLHTDGAVESNTS